MKLAAKEKELDGQVRTEPFADMVPGWHIVFVIGKSERDADRENSSSFKR
jgi:hypothetical protein